MILVAYKKAEGAREELEEAVRRAFSSAENSGYFDEIAARKNDSSARDSLTALLLLADTARKFGIDTGALILHCGENGKPYFADCTLDFSISHSRGTVAVAVSDSGAVGIDVEAAQITDDKARKLAERYFRGDVSRFPEKATDFLRLWVQREAYVKLCGSTLAEKIGKEIPEQVKVYDFEIFGHPACVCFMGEQTVRFDANPSED